MTRTPGADGVGDSILSAFEIEARKIEAEVTRAAQARRAAELAAATVKGGAGGTVVQPGTP